MLYLLNTPILTAYGDFRFTGPIGADDARARIIAGYQSAVGHESSAAFLSRLLDLPVPMNRIAVTMVPGDAALVLRVKSRLAEGKLLTEDEFSAVPYELGWLERLT